MTIIATYRYEDSAFYVNDFRVTMQEPFRQYDVSFKFMDFSGRMGLFLAGDVNLWKNVITKIPNILQDVNTENILDQFGPFAQGITKEVQVYSKIMFGKAGAIGFLIDDTKRINAQFVIELYPGEGCLVKEVLPNSCVVIGSGEVIPDIEKNIEEKFKKDYEVYGFAPYDLVCGMRSEILSLLKRAGSSSFSKLGISPCMAVSTLVGSHFMIRGEENSGETTINDILHKYSFSFERDSNGDIILKDLINNTKQIVNDISKMNNNIHGEIFDPQMLTEDIDIADTFLDANEVYLMDQWVPDGENFIWRSVDIITFINFKGKRMCNPERRRIAYSLIEGIDKYDISKYVEQGKHYFTLDEDSSGKFEADIQNKLFDNVWLSQIIPNYSEIYR